MDVKKLVAKMTLDEKASLCSGLDFWHTKPVERLNIPSVMMSDGPHGLRKQNERADHLAMNESIEAVCFPAGCAMAASFDRVLFQKLGDALGSACQAEKLALVLGPAINIKRSPLCGRNFEYLSEDPYLAGEEAAAYIKGVQGRNVGVSVKHYAANNQEHRRMSSSSVVDERTMYEIYLAAFETAVKESKPWTIMASYNRINGTYATESRFYLTDILRNEWGFDGFVVSDWGAVSDRVKGVAAGMDLEMPSSGGVNDEKIMEAVEQGRLDEKALDASVERILNIVFRYTENARPDTKWDKELQHELSASIAAECMVLLKNEGGILPLEKSDTIAFIGEFAANPRFQGGGSSHINCFETTSALDAAREYKNISYAKGFDILTDSTTEALLEEAEALAKKARVAVVFAGLPDSYESEGYDRVHMRLPECQNELIRRVSRANPNAVVVLYNGSPVEMPWVDDVKAVLEAYLGGQAVGKATLSILFGETNPSGKLPETFPLKLEDNPSYLFFGGEGDKAEYREGVFVGYRYYDKKKMEVLFPFGHGLSYTAFAYSNLKADKTAFDENEAVTVTVDVKNTGKVFGKEVVELYVADRFSEAIRPEKELKGFQKLALAPGETKTAVFKLDKRAFAYWNTTIHGWYVESGEFDILIGSSSRDMRLKTTVNVSSDVRIPVVYTENSIFMDLLRDPCVKTEVKPMLDAISVMFGPDKEESDVARAAVSADMAEAMLRYMPLRAVFSFGGGEGVEDRLNALLDRINRA
ncbi:MAG TPA: glycoside hydrolase family 3 C-terminal domain-containing protein [Clostridia bacterium]|nr:glycoside hydrolase family 3 C-terminal domain-containing protein [Clostridia bacterium]